MSGPASTTAVLTVRVPTPGPPTSPCAGVRPTPPMRDLQRRLPPHAVSPGVNSGLKYAPATTVAGQFEKPALVPQPPICAFDARASPGTSRRYVALAWHSPVLTGLPPSFLVYHWSVHQPIPCFAAALVLQ